MHITYMFAAVKSMSTNNGYTLSIGYICQGSEIGLENDNLSQKPENFYKNENTAV